MSQFCVATISPKPDMFSSVFFFKCIFSTPPFIFPTPTPTPSAVHLVLHLYTPLPSSRPPSSLCILDHFLSFQVSRPVEANNPPPGGAGPPHCLRSISVSLCSRYAHSPHPVGVGWRGRGAG
ncbi:hypothetical protein AMECASPLE_015790 [Ameca splendens]|uniref:Uncharacterized protein n=1 Tax=Ameca splendens TaxID=208324 RepID=A0ABV0ZAT5_9TELE